MGPHRARQCGPQQNVGATVAVRCSEHHPGTGCTTGAIYSARFEQAALTSQQEQCGFAALKFGYEAVATAGTAGILVRPRKFYNQPAAGMGQRQCGLFDVYRSHFGNCKPQSHWEFCHRTSTGIGRVPANSALGRAHLLSSTTRFLAICK